MSPRTRSRLCRAGLGLLALLVGLALPGCARRSGPPPFHAADGRSLALRRDGEGRYLLRRAAMVDSEALALYLRYRGDPQQAELVVYGAARGEETAPAAVIARRPLPAPATGLEAAAHLPLPAGSRVTGFAVRPPAGGAASGGVLSAPGPELQLLEAGLGPQLRGLRREAALLRFGPEVASFSESPGGLELRLALEGPADLAAGAWQIQLRYGSLPAPSWAQLRLLEDPQRAPGPPARVQARVRLEAEGGARELRQRGLAGEQRLALPGPLVGFVPERLLLQAEEGGSLALAALEVRRSGGPLEPIAADPGAILLYPQERWRGEQYELFAWSRFPEILIMDTSSYAVQSRFFKRLAFFVEKRGYRGRLLSDEQFAGLHGFNAHDYRAEDLARFFNQARAQEFPLNAEEQLLARLLVANGVLREAEGYQPGRGGILSISRSSSALLRRHLLTHESCHGLYFVLPEFRQAAQERWQAIGADERAFWELFFLWVGYDVADEYLAANEYQAYLFQQEREAVEAYFRELIAPRLMGRYPQAAAGIRALLDASPDLFSAGFNALEPALVRSAGLEGGRLIELLPADSPR